MVNKLKQTDNYFPHFLLLFIVFQPILDLLTSFFNLYTTHERNSWSCSPFRLYASCIRIPTSSSQTTRCEKYILYLCLLGIALAIGLVNNMMVKSQFHLEKKLNLS